MPSIVQRPTTTRSSSTSRWPWPRASGCAGRPRTDHLDEFAELARAAGARIVGTLETRREQPAPRYFVGTGKADELKALVSEREARLVIFDHDLSPAQERNLEAHLEARVLSRTGLILDIFAQRARTHEGKLQVELAQLEHMAARLVRGWSHLDREKGGIGLRGAGEKQLELDQRLLQGRISQIRKRLDTVRRTRAQSRRARQRAELPLIAVVGYTNAGKSTLFNAVAESGVFAADQVFATLDPTLRRIDVPGLGPAVLADTVGFVRRLPHKLVEAFKATLEEVVEADLLLHVLDASDPAMDDKRAAVSTVLEEIDALTVPTIELLNKIDATDDPTDAAGAWQGQEGPLQVHHLPAMDTVSIYWSRRSPRFSAHRFALRFASARRSRMRARCYEQGQVVERAARMAARWICICLATPPSVLRGRGCAGFVRNIRACCEPSPFRGCCRVSTFSLRVVDMGLLRLIRAAPNAAAHKHSLLLINQAGVPFRSGSRHSSPRTEKHMAWNEPGGGRNNDPWGDRKDDPWGRGGNDKGPPDMDEAFRSMQEQLARIFGGKSGSGGGASGAGGPSAQLVAVLAGLAVVAYLVSGFYTLDEQERGVIFRFGAVEQQIAAGSARR